MPSASSRQKLYIRFGRLVLAAMVMLSGCATKPTPPAAVFLRPALAPVAESAWWFVRFRVNWPEGAEPAWHIDLLTAHRIIKPLLEEHSRDIYLWRFHRRAARDAAGHQFSFIFFAPSETARQVYSEISQDPTLALARSAGRILEVVFDDLAAAARSNVSDTSDPNWSDALRRAWPFYLMGASQMWLDLVSQMTDDAHETKTHLAIDDLDHRYAGVHVAITRLWQNEGQHAFLHHLNALFGYEPILIIEKRYMRF